MICRRFFEPLQNSLGQNQNQVIAVRGSRGFLEILPVQFSHQRDKLPLNAHILLCPSGSPKPGPVEKERERDRD